MYGLLCILLVSTKFVRVSLEEKITKCRVKEEYHVYTSLLIVVVLIVLIHDHV